MKGQTLIYLGVIAALGYAAFYFGHRQGASKAGRAFQEAAADAPLPQRASPTLSLVGHGSISGSNTGGDPAAGVF